MVLYVAFYVFYLVAGSLVFMVLEGDQEPVGVERSSDEDQGEIETEAGNNQQVLEVLVESFVKEHPCVSDDSLEAFIQQVIAAHERGVSAVRNVTMEPTWSFGQSLFFSATVITTIGYGHVTPLSEGGKIFCIVYALIGIPLTLILLTAFVERLMIPATLLLQFLNSRLGHLYQPFNIRIFHLSIIVTLVVILFYIVPSVVFAAIEPQWDFLDSFYYCIISLTTIGLGDYVPGDYPDQPYRLVYKICTTVYLLAGLTFMMLVLTVFYEIPQLNFGLFFLLRSDECQRGDTEKTRLHGSHGQSGPKYTPQVDDNIRHSIRIKPHAGDMSSPEDNRP